MPLVQAGRFPGDNDIYGYRVQFPRAAVRFCLPFLDSPTGRFLAETNSIPMFDATTDWEFRWLSYYDQVHETVMAVVHQLINSQRRPSPAVVHSAFRRAINRLVNGGKDEDGKESGFPLTDEAISVRHMYDVRIGYPDVPGNDLLYSMIKYRYLEAVDSICDITWTGKNHTGREVGRVLPDDPRSFITGQPLPRLALSFNPLGAHLNPARAHREGRSCGGWLEIANPVEPPIRCKGIALPKGFRNRVTTLMTAIIDIPGMNVFQADAVTAMEYGGDRVEPGEEISLDGLLVTRSGREKLQAKVRENETKPADEFLPMLPELKEREGFQFEELPTTIETLADGTEVIAYEYRYHYDRPTRCRIDKVKALSLEGIKGVARPIKQLFTEIGGEMLPVDIVVSERTVLSKGSRGALYPLAALAGIAEIDPAWTWEEICEKVEAGLKEKGLPETGRFPIYTTRRVPVYNGKVLTEEEAAGLEGLGLTIHKRSQRVLVGHAIVGPVVWCRPQEHEFRQSSYKAGVSLNFHSRLLGGVEFIFDEKMAAQIEQIGEFFYDHCEVGTDDVLEV
jgi:hypothetical protein